MKLFRYFSIVLQNFQLFYVLAKAYTSTPRYAHSAALIGNKLYILGGDNNSTSAQFIPTKDFFYLDISVGFNTSNIPWTDLSSVVGTPKQSRAAVSAGGPNKDIIFLFGGGVENPNSDIPLVYTFDTLKNVWDTPTILGIKPPRREYIKSVTDNTDTGPTNLRETTVGTIPEARAHHTSVLGFIFSQEYANPSMYILDIGDDSDYKWVKSFDPNSLLVSNPNPNSNSSPNKNEHSISTGIMISVIIGISLASILIIIFALMVYRWYKKRKYAHAIPTHGNSKL
ncbi:13250_t:CDS:2 [Gigaspora rosea]|nr:13250_t:CDS:2 [Gigaspora rosea]